jgi:hypothetical protein
LKEKKLNWKPARPDALVNIQSKLSMVGIGGRDKPIWVILKKREVYQCRNMECN